MEKKEKKAKTVKSVASLNENFDTFFLQILYGESEDLPHQPAQSSKVSERYLDFSCF